MVVKYAKDKEFEKIVAGDQLRKEMELGTPYAGFRELDIRFPPTYRWERGKEEFSNKKSQNPSYTDRILIRSLPRLEDSVAPLFYASDPSVNFVSGQDVSCV